MKRVWLMFLALSFFLVAPAMAQEGDAGSNGGAGSAESGAAGGGEGADAGEDAPPGDSEEDQVDEPIGEDAIPGDPADEGDVDAEDPGDDDEAIGDEAIPEEELVTAGGGMGDQPWTFGSMDANADGSMTVNEFGSGLFALLVPEGMEGLTQTDYEAVIDQFGLTGSEEASFEVADGDGDNMVTDEEEFTPSFASALLEQWDTDGNGSLSSSEYSANFLAAVDADENGTIDDNEFESVAHWFDTGFEEVAGGGGAETGFGEEFFLGEQGGPGVDATEEQDPGGPADEGADNGAAGGADEEMDAPGAEDQDGGAPADQDEGDAGQQ